MSVSSAEVGSPLPCATSTIACASSRARSRVGQERARADLDVHHQRVEPGGELLGQDRGDDQRDRLDGAGGVADRVQAPVGGRELARSGRRSRSRPRHRRARSASRSGADVVAGDRLELVERAAGVAEAAAGDHRHRAAAGRDDRREQQADLVADAAGRVLVEAGPGRPASQSSTSPESRIAPVSAIRSAAVMPRQTIAIASAPTCASLTEPSAMPATRNADLLVGQLAAVALAPDQLGDVALGQSPPRSA